MWGYSPSGILPCNRYWRVASHSISFGIWQSLCFGQALNINLDLYLITQWCVWRPATGRGHTQRPSPGPVKGLGLPKQEFH